MLRHCLGNTLWTLGNCRHFLRYRRALRDPRRTQERILFSFLKRNANSSYGREYRYAGIRSVRQFQREVPIVNYDSLEPWIDRVCGGETNVLTTEPVLLMEKTSGSSGAAKYVPYTTSLLEEFQNAVGAWMFELFTRRPALLGGAQYWSITPASRQRERTIGGLPVGFDADIDYFGPLARRTLSWVMAVPGELANVPDLEENRRQTLKHLTRCRNLRFISVWNPSFLTLLMDELPPGVLPRDLWPRLQLISCWASGASARFLPRLREWFPGVEIQGKGLLATEGVVSFPVIGQSGSVPAITSHFLEFVSDDGCAHLVDELEVGERYSVVITSGGGFARYDLGDRVEVVAPGAIEFVGRKGQASDLCGEKLTDTFVGSVIEAATAQLNLAGFAMLAPEWGSPPRYVLFVKANRAGEVAALVERRLRASVQYDYCRRLGQLAPVEGVRVSSAEEGYLRGCEELGQRAGDVKPAYLRRELGWRERMARSACG